MQPAWRLSNAVMAEARAISAAAALLAEDRIAEAAYRHGETAVEGLALAAAQGNWPPARLAEAARMLGSLVIPPFPISGADLVALGMKKGPELGAELRRLERVWIDSGFALDQARLLAEVRF